MEAEHKRVVICGGGAGGIELAVRLASRTDLDVHLVDPSPTHIWKPLLHEIASGTLDVSSQEVSYLALAEWRGFVFAQGHLEGLNRAARSVSIGPALGLDGREIIPRRELSYDVLVLSVGGVTADFGIPGVTAHARFLDTAADAERIFDRILQACMSANYKPEIVPPGHFRVCIVGGGATGVELAAELRSSVRALAAYGLDTIDPDRYLSITVVNADARLVQQLPERVSNSVQSTLERLGIETRNASAVVAVQMDAVVLKGGERLVSDMTIWAAGVRAPRLLAGLGGLETNRSDQIVVTSSLQSVSDPAVFALGDCAAAPWAGTNARVPPRAQAANQEAAFLARAIPRYLAGEHLGEFHYNDLGSLLSLGEEHAVGRLMGFIRGAGLEVEGFAARLLYRWLYKRHLAVLFGWGLVMLDSVGNWIRRSTRPRVKLH
ncbi:MAG: NAD(P)/FAD-dependent oxidoreductase [Hyphomicrobiaceae bacterium]